MRPSNLIRSTRTRVSNHVKASDLVTLERRALFIGSCHTPRLNLVHEPVLSLTSPWINPYRFSRKLVACRSFFIALHGSRRSETMLSAYACMHHCPTAQNISNLRMKMFSFDFLCFDRHGGVPSYRCTILQRCVHFNAVFSLQSQTFRILFCKFTSEALLKADGRGTVQYLKSCLSSCKLHVANDILIPCHIYLIIFAMFTWVLLEQI